MSHATESPALALSRSLAAAVAAGGPSVVRVEARPHRPSSGVVWEDGLILTADHVVERDEDITLGLPDGRTVPAALAGRDPGTNLALLRTEPAGLAAPAWADEPPAVGQLVLSVLRPGRSARAALDIVSAWSAEEWRTPAGGRLDGYLETGLPIETAFSGSLLVDAAGRALGLNTAGILRRHALGVPVATLRRVVPALLAHGRVRRGYLGLAGQPVRLPKAQAESTGQTFGLLIVGVQPDTAAEQAGLLLGDVVLALDGQPLGNPRDLQGLLGEDRVGEEVTLRVLRGGEIRELRATVGSR